jgi:hypothetical protein
MTMAITTSKSVSFDPKAVGYGLGWFSLALGFTELVFARGLASILGMKGQENLIRAYGARELATGIAILRSGDPTPWIWGRVAGDALDIATLARYAGDDNPERGNVAIALAAVAGATAMDIAVATALPMQEEEAESAARDYSDRSGFPMGVEAARGAARDFLAPRDMRAPDAMRPNTLH